MAPAEETTTRTIKLAVPTDRVRMFEARPAGAVPYAYALFNKVYRPTAARDTWQRTMALFADCFARD